MCYRTEQNYTENPVVALSRVLLDVVVDGLCYRRRTAVSTTPWPEPMQRASRGYVNNKLSF